METLFENERILKFDWRNTNKDYPMKFAYIISLLGNKMERAICQYKAPNHLIFSQRFLETRK